MLSSANAVAAIQCIGLAAASGVWCGTAVVVSFVCGIRFAGDEIEHLPQAVAAVGLTLAGIAGIALAAWMGGSQDAAASEGAAALAEGADSVASSLLGADHYTALTLEASAGSGAYDAGTPARPAEGPAAAGAPGGPPAHGWQQRLTPRARALLGLLAAVAAGALGGLILAPMLAAPKEARGLPFVPSMAAGALLLAPAVTALLVAAGHVTFQHVRLGGAG